MKRSHSICLTLALFAPMSAFAASLTIPSLPNGSTYRMLFITSELISATSSSITTYDSFVNAVANNTGGYSGSLVAPLGATWTALVKTPTADNFAALGTFSDPVYMMDGTLLVTGSDLFLSGAPGYSTDNVFTEEGVQITSVQRVWSGFNNSLGNNSGTAQVGYVGSGSGFGYLAYAAVSEVSQSQSFAVWAVSNQLVVGDAAPEPGTIFTMLGGAAILALASRKRRA